MKRFAFLCILVLGLHAFSEEGPIKSQGWYWYEDQYFDGKLLKSNEIPRSYREQGGYAIVNNRKIWYWLYDTYTYYKGNRDKLYNVYLPSWVEYKRFAIDFDNIRVISPNEELAASVKQLMQQRGCDVSVALVENPKQFPIIPFLLYFNYSEQYMLIVNEYNKETEIYSTTFYPLIR